MKILLYRYGSICEPDIISGFEELGFEVTQITKEMENKNFVFSESVKYVSHFLLEHPHDCVFSINFFPQISEVCNIFHIPYICWIVDSPVLELFTKSIQNSCNKVFIFDREQYLEIAPLNPRNIFHFPLAVNVENKQFVIKHASAKMRQKYSSELSFVGSLYTEKNPYDALQNAPDFLYGFLDGIMEAQLHVYGYYFIEELLTDEIVDQFKKYYPDFYHSPFENFLSDKKVLSQYYIGNKITTLERIRTFQILSQNFSVDIYTRSNTTSLPHIHNHGFAKTFSEMPVIFHESKININTTSKAIRSGIPLRVFDIMGCEGFVLSNFQNELTELFETENEFDSYENMEELIDKTNYYLTHEKMRKEIAHNGFEKVRDNFNYPLRLAQLMELAYA